VGATRRRHESRVEFSVDHRVTRPKNRWTPGPPNHPRQTNCLSEGPGLSRPLPLLVELQEARVQMLDPAGVEPNSDQPVSGACHDDASAAPGNAMPRRPDRVRGDDRSPMSNSGGSSKVVDGGNGHLCVATGARQRGATSCRAVTGATGYPGRLRHRAAVPRVPGRLPDLAWTGRPAEHAPQRLGGGRPAGGWYARATRPQRRAAPGHRAARNSPRSSPTCSFRRRLNSSAPTPRSLDGSAPPCFEWPHRSAVGHVGAPGVGLPGLVTAEC
jgi:hypothetical protein